MRFVSIALIVSALIASASPTAGAQSVSLFNVDASAYPTVRGSFYAFDQSGQPVSPDASQITLIESGIAVPARIVTCPPQTPTTTSLSSVLSFDISSSMISSTSSPNSLYLAQIAAKAWIEELSPGSEE